MSDYPSPTFQSITVLDALTVPQPLILSGFFPGNYSANQVLYNWDLPLTGTFLAGLSGSVLTCDPIIASNGTITFSHGGTVSGTTLTGGTVFATGAFSSGSSVGTLTAGANVTITAPGNVTAVAPATVVSSLQGISVSLLGSRVS